MVCSLVFYLLYIGLCAVVQGILGYLLVEKKHSSDSYFLLLWFLVFLCLKYLKFCEVSFLSLVCEMDIFTKLVKISKNYEIYGEFKSCM